MRIMKVLSLCLSVAAFAAPAFAQDAEMPQMTPEQQAEMEAYTKAGAPGPQHGWLAGQVGTYDVAITSWMDPGGPPVESKGVATRTMHMDGRILHEEFEGDMMGMPFTGLSRVGYDNVSRRYWSTWTDSMSTGISVSEGDCDEQHTCRYVGTYNDPVKGGPVTTRYEMRWKSPDEQVLVMYGPGPDGAEVKMMEMTYTRR